MTICAPRYFIAQLFTEHSFSICFYELIESVFSDTLEHLYTNWFARHLCKTRRPSGTICVHRLNEQLICVSFTKTPMEITGKIIVQGRVIQA